MKDKYFVFTGLQSWDLPIGSNAKNIAEEVSENNFVLYINTPKDSILFLFKKLINKYKNNQIGKKQVRQISKKLWVADCPFYVLPVNILPDGFIFDFFNRLNNKKIFSYANKIASQLGFKDIIHFIDNDIYRSFYSKEYLKPYLSVYYRRDYLFLVDYWKKHAIRLEPLLISKSDLVVCNSPQLAEFALIYNPDSFCIGQGLDLTAYDIENKFEIPEKMLSIPEPRIGYIGNITSLRLDADLIYEMAKSKPELSFVMVGREDKHFESHNLHNLKNVYFLGSIKPEQVPDFTFALNVCINPQLINELTMVNYPRKVDEYLALGKPVIATKTASMDLFKNHVYLCSNVEEYLFALDKALNDNSNEAIFKRVIFAKSHSWENNVKCLYNCIENILQ